MSPGNVIGCVGKFNVSFSRYYTQQSCRDGVFFRRERGRSIVAPCGVQLEIITLPQVKYGTAEDYQPAHTHHQDRHWNAFTQVLALAILHHISCTLPHTCIDCNLEEGTMIFCKLVFTVSAVAFFAIACTTTETQQTASINPQSSPTPAAPPAATPTHSPAALPTASPDQSPAVSPSVTPTATPRGKVSPSPTASPATARATPSPTPEVVVDLTAARTTYQRNCAACHGRNGEGDPDGAPGLKRLAYSDSKLASKIANGGNGMPAYKGRLTKNEITGLVRLIRQGL